MEADLVRELRKLADETYHGKYGHGDDFGAAAFWEDFDEMQTAMEMYVPDPSAT